MKSALTKLALLGYIQFANATSHEHYEDIGESCDTLSLVHKWTRDEEPFGDANKEFVNSWASKTDEEIADWMVKNVYDSTKDNCAEGTKCSLHEDGPTGPTCQKCYYEMGFHLTLMNFKLVDDETGLEQYEPTSAQIAEHEKFGGVVPELAARAHLENIEFIINKSLNDAKIN